MTRLAVWIAFLAGILTAGAVGSGFVGLLHVTLGGAVLIVVLMWVALRLTRPRRAS
jgi:hypothetical protein